LLGTDDRSTVAALSSHQSLLKIKPDQDVQEMVLVDGIRRHLAIYDGFSNTRRARKVLCLRLIIYMAL
jgi:hypothetical protein